MDQHKDRRFVLSVFVAAFCGCLCAQFAIVGVRAAVAVPKYLTAVQHAKESVLKEDLSTLRGAIDSYSAEKKKAPQSIDDLLRTGYLKSIPVDPMTRSSMTWMTDGSGAAPSPGQMTASTHNGIHDVHSGSDETGSDGQPYNTW
jgi:general secretion pathway protein G